MKLFLFSCLSVINIEYSSVNEPSLSGDSFEPKGMWTWAKDHSVEIFFSIMIFYLLYKNNSLSKLMNEMNSQLIAEIEKIKSSLPSKKYINNNIKNLNVHLKKHIQCDKSVKYYFHREIQQF